jgi:hypothetical protein
MIKVDQDLFNWGSLLSAYLAIISRVSCMQIFEDPAIHRFRPQLLHLMLDFGRESTVRWYFSFFQSEIVSLILSCIRTFIPVRVKSFLYSQSLHRLLCINSIPGITHFNQIANLKIRENIIDSCELPQEALWLLNAIIEFKHYLFTPPYSITCIMQVLKGLFSD